MHLNNTIGMSLKQSYLLHCLKVIWLTSTLPFVTNTESLFSTFYVFSVEKRGTACIRAFLQESVPPCALCSRNTMVLIFIWDEYEENPLSMLWGFGAFMVNRCAVLWCGRVESWDCTESLGVLSWKTAPYKQRAAKRIKWPRSEHRLYRKNNNRPTFT